MSYKALLFCSEETTARVIAQVLSDLDFLGEPCNEPFAAVKKLTSGRLDAMVIDCSNEQDVALLVKSARNSSFNQQALFVAVVEGKSGVSNAFRLGANLVLTKPVSLEQARSTLRVARGLLHKSEVAKSAVPTAQLSSRPEPETASIAARVPSASWAPASSVSAPPPSILELEKEPAPRLEPAEAGVLESVPDLPGNGGPAPSAKEEHPWQGAAEPVASSLLEAEEAAGETETNGMSTAPSSLPASPSGEDLPAETAAALPAHTPEAETSGGEEAGKTVSDQWFAPTAFDNPVKQEAESSKKKWLAIALIILAVIAAGYVAWMQLHPSVSGVAVPNHLSSTPAASPAPAVQPATPPTASELTPAEGAGTDLSQPSAGQTQQQPASGVTAPTQTAPAQKIPAKKATSTPPANAPEQ